MRFFLIWCKLSLHRWCVKWKGVVRGFNFPLLALRTKKFKLHGCKKRYSSFRRHSGLSRSLSRGRPQSSLRQTKFCRGRFNSFLWSFKFFSISQPNLPRSWDLKKAVRRNERLKQNFCWPHPAPSIAQGDLANASPKELVLGNPGFGVSSCSVRSFVFGSGFKVTIL